VTSGLPPEYAGDGPDTKGGYLPVGSFKIQVPVIVNSNTAQVLVVTEIPLSPPAFKIDEIHKVIEIDDS
jgi:hypothetical protein